MKSSSHAVRSCKLLPAASLRQFSGGSSSLLREFAGFKNLGEPCGDDVEDELVVELDDSPRTTRRTKVLSLASDVLPVFGQMWLLSTGPLIRASVLFAERDTPLRADCPPVNIQHSSKQHTTNH